jgi:hypothetical protein
VLLLLLVLVLPLLLLLAGCSLAANASAVWLAGGVASPPGPQLPATRRCMSSLGAHTTTSTRLPVLALGRVRLERCGAQ